MQGKPWTYMFECTSNQTRIRLKVAGFKCSTLLKINFFISIFKEFWPHTLEHLFSRTPLSGCFRCLFCISFIINMKIFLSVLISLNFSWVCWKPQKLSKGKFSKSLNLDFWYSKVDIRNMFSERTVSIMFLFPK